jgi:hypothetical protein
LRSSVKADFIACYRGRVGPLQKTFNRPQRGVFVPRLADNVVDVREGGSGHKEFYAPWDKASILSAAS